MSKFEFIADYFRQLPSQLDKLLGVGSSLAVKGNSSEAPTSSLQLSPRFELRFEDSVDGTRVVSYEKGAPCGYRELPLFSGAWVDVDVRLAMTSPCAEVISLPGGQLKIYTAQNLSHRISWLDSKGISVEETARFIELFVLSLVMRPGELSLETFSISQSFAAWKEQQTQGGQVPGLSLNDGTNRFFTLRVIETKDLLIDSLKAQALTSWRHWSSLEQTRVSGQERLVKKQAFLPEGSSDRLDLENGFTTENCGNEYEELFLENLSALSGNHYRSQEVLLAQV